jgi:hypothetical protein
VISIDRNQENKIRTKRTIPENYNKKNQRNALFLKSYCGNKVLVVLHLTVMDEAM